MIYVDTSAFMKTVWPEAESTAVEAYVTGRTDLASSRLLVVEARRSTLRENPSILPRVDVLLSTFTLLAVSDAVLESASRLPQPYLRSLDAIHLATALLLRDELEALLTYDDRLADAARAHGIEVAAPGAP